MAFIPSLLIATLVVTLTTLVQESEGRIPPAADIDDNLVVGDVDDFDLGEDLSSSLTRRAADVDFPPFPGDDYDTIGLETEAPLPTVPTNPTYPTPEPTIPPTEKPSKPWYKKVGRFFKKHYTTIKDSLRGRRNDYYYTE